MEGKYMPTRPVDSHVTCYHGLIDFANLFKSFVGTQYMTLSYGFLQSGVVLGIIGIGVVALLTGHCCHMLVKCKYYTIEHVCSLIEGLKKDRGKARYNRDDIQTLAETMQRRLTYTDIGHVVYGRVGTIAVTCCLLVTQIGFCVGYHIFIGNVLLTLIIAALQDSSPADLTTQPVQITTPPTYLDTQQYNLLASQDNTHSVNQLLEVVISDNKSNQHRTHRFNITKRDVYNAIYSDKIQGIKKDMDGIGNRNMYSSQIYDNIRTYVRGQSNSAGKRRNVRDVDVDRDDAFNIDKNIEKTIFEIEQQRENETGGVSVQIGENNYISAPDDGEYNINEEVARWLSEIESGEYENATSDAAAVSLEMEDATSQASPPEAKSDLPLDPQYLLMILAVSPLPLFMIFTLFRKVRGIGPISVIANFTVILGFVVILAYICIDFEIAPGVELAAWVTFPVLLGQAVASYEAIGTLLSIEGSMEGNQYRFGSFLTGAIFSFTSLFTPLAVLGYAKYGVDTEQILLLNLPQDSTVLVIVEITTLIGVLCTYPIQVFPVTELAEQLAFGRPQGTEERSTIGADTPILSSASTSTLALSGDETPLLQEKDCLQELGIKVTNVIPRHVPTWKRNLLRFCIAILVAVLAIVFRNAYAYAGALVGALGSTPLAFIFPCLLEMKLLEGRISIAGKIKNIIIIVLTGILSLGIVVIVIGAMVNLA